MIKIKKKIIFGITSLGLGGAERVLVDVANELAEEYDVSIFSIYDKGELKSELKDNINFNALYDCQFNELSGIKKRVVALRVLLFGKGIYKRYIRGNFDTEIAFLEGPITRIFCNKNDNAKKIAWIHNDIANVFGSGILAKIKKRIDEKIYKKYDRLVFVSEDNMKSFKNTYPSIASEKMQVIYNYINPDLVIKKSNADDGSDTINGFGHPNFVTVCRLTKQKAVERLIEVHSRLISNGLYNEIYVIGDGPEKDFLEEIIKRKNLNKTFKLLGKKNNPYPYIKNADYFCLLSNFEGYGMVLDEAKILNKRIIITDTAAREAVKGYNKSKILENTEEGIYTGLANIIKNDNIFDDNVLVNYDNKERIEKIKQILE